MPNQIDAVERSADYELPPAITVEFKRHFEALSAESVRLYKNVIAAQATFVQATRVNATDHKKQNDSSLTVISEQREKITRLAAAVKKEAAEKEAVMQTLKATKDRLAKEKQEKDDIIGSVEVDAALAVTRLELLREAQADKNALQIKLQEKTTLLRDQKEEIEQQRTLLAHESAKQREHEEDQKELEQLRAERLGIYVRVQAEQSAIFKKLMEKTKRLHEHETERKELEELRAENKRFKTWKASAP
tara:strand:- start:314 stop:1054 length:741 start_codon:yes stop_codon:yes gene_type:complete